jgi:hypothetical protein
MTPDGLQEYVLHVGKHLVRISYISSYFLEETGANHDQAASSQSASSYFWSDWHGANMSQTPLTFAED